MTLSFGSVCSGIGAPELAWERLGMVPRWCSEIADFPSRVLAYHRPHVPNLGDFTKIGADVQAAAVDVLVGGTPCQSFSIAGGRAGLDDPRGHLAIEFLRLARRLGARWLVWENVADTLSVDGGDAFATFLRLMVECGYGLAWRVLDAQGFGVPQRRRRIFVVGHLGDWRPPAAVLLERPSMQRHPRARTPEGAQPASAPGGGATRSVANAITTRPSQRLSAEDNYVVGELDEEEGDLDPNAGVAKALIASAGKSSYGADQTFALGFHATQDPISVRNGTSAMSAEHSGSIAVLPIQEAEAARGSQNGAGVGEVGDPMYTLTTRRDHAVFAFDEAQITHPENRATVSPAAPAPTISKNSRLRVAGGLRPRRLTPRECERLQGFPDDYTRIPGASDSARYMALGNSMATPVMTWIGRRLLAVDTILKNQREHTK